MVIAELLPSCARSAEAFADVDGEPPFPGEEPLLATAREGRRREFITARRCAREALAGLGVAPVPILTGPRREPIWPAGVRGSITHCAGYRAAAVVRLGDLDAVGIDAEPNEPLPDKVGRLVTVAEERDRLAGLEAGPVHWDRLLFSAKESVYKAWFPLTGRWLGFEDACLSIDPAAGTFHARILIDGARLDGGPPLTGLSGRFVVGRGLLVTAVTVRSAPAAG